MINTVLASALLFSLRLTPDVTGVEGYKQPQLVASGSRVAMTFGSPNTVWVAVSENGGASFSAPVKVATVEKLPLGRRRGPRIAIAGGRLLVTAIRDGNVAVWLSADNGRTWDGPRVINDVPNAAREGFQSVSAIGNRVLVTWLDLRTKAMQLYSAVSNDGGATWGPNTLVYASPDGHICECCHTTAVIGADGKLYAMYRNWLGGDRDMYLAISSDNGKSWQPQKLGQGSWVLNACPMDGGSVQVDRAGKITTVWRRDDTVYVAEAGKPERALGKGTQPQIVGNSLIVWSDGPALKLLRPGQSEPMTLTPSGAFVTLAPLDGGSVLAAWEDKGAIQTERIGVK